MIKKSSVNLDWKCSDLESFLFFWNQRVLVGMGSHKELFCSKREGDYFSSHALSLFSLTVNCSKFSTFSLNVLNEVSY